MINPMSREEDYGKNPRFERNEHGLTNKEEIFCHEYIKDFNGKRSAIAAGWMEAGASVQASRTLVRPNVKKRIDQLKSERYERLKIDADYVLQRLVEIDSLDAADIIDEENNILPIKQWPPEWRRYMASFEIGENLRGDTILKKIKWPDKVKNLELIGKHIEVSAWKENAAVNVTTMIETKSLADIFTDMSDDGDDDDNS